MPKPGIRRKAHVRDVGWCRDDCGRATGSGRLRTKVVVPQVSCCTERSQTEEGQLTKPAPASATWSGFSFAPGQSMDFTLFFAWQFDSPPNDNRYLIRDAAKDAVKRVAADADVEESPRLDHDTKGLSGTPEVANAIFAKIERAGMFLGDVTYVGLSRSHDKHKKKLPNMNVAVEMGYAGKAIGWERIILVMNKAYGKPDEQIFDIKHRRNPITYDVPADSTANKRKEEKRKLSKAIEEAVRMRLKCEHEGVRD